MPNTLATILASAISPDNPVNRATTGYMNENLPPAPVPPPPAAWLPPGFQMQPEPQPWEPPMFRQDPNAPPLRFRGVPNFHRLNPGPPDSWRDMET